MKKYIIFIFLILLSSCGKQPTIRVGAKHFNEGYILGEIVSQLLESRGYNVERSFNLGGTLICFDALKNHAIDIYPEYTGTISEEILKLKNKVSLNELNDSLKSEFNLAISATYGFNNTYALIMKKELTTKLNITKISDLINHPELNIALSYEFLKRNDGWDKLKSAYGLKKCCRN